MSDLIQAARWQHPDSIPVGVSLLPATWAKYGKDLTKLCERHPLLFSGVRPDADTTYFTPPSYHAGSFTDAWGCVWSNVKEGYESIVTGHPLKEREDIHTLRAPDTDIGLPHGFMFLRLTDLRGFEEMMIDFAEEPPELQTLIDIVRDYNVRQMRKICENTKDEMIFVGDDNGIQTSLPINPRTWRKYLKPAYAAIFGEAKKYGKLVYFHTDGCIYSVMPDMQEAGADIINPQFRANGLDNLVRVCKGKIPINLDLDRQIFPFATPEELEKHVMDCVKALYLPEGGLGIQAECADDVPLENIEAICFALEKAAEYKGE